MVIALWCIALSVKKNVIDRLMYVCVYLCICDTVENLHVTCESAAVIVISWPVLRGIIPIAHFHCKSYSINRIVTFILSSCYFFFKKEKQTLLCEFIELHPPEGNELKFLREFIYFFFSFFF